MNTDVVIVGGGSAGLQAALTLGRMLGAHELAPLELLAKGRAQLTELPSVELIEVDSFGHTAVEGIYAAGDLVVTAPAVAQAVASGQRAAVGITRDLAA